MLANASFCIRTKAGKFLIVIEFNELLEKAFKPMVSNKLNPEISIEVKLLPLNPDKKSKLDKSFILILVKLLLANESCPKRSRSTKPIKSISLIELFLNDSILIDNNFTFPEKSSFSMLLLVNALPPIFVKFDISCNFTIVNELSENA